MRPKTKTKQNAKSNNDAALLCSARKMRVALTLQLNFATWQSTFVDSWGVWGEGGREVATPHREFECALLKCKLKPP